MTVAFELLKTALEAIGRWLDWSEVVARLELLGLSVKLCLIEEER